MRGHWEHCTSRSSGGPTKIMDAVLICVADSSRLLLINNNFHKMLYFNAYNEANETRAFVEIWPFVER